MTTLRSDRSAAPLAIDSIDVIDTDTHIIEPPDLWTSRMSVERWGDRVPHVRYLEEADEEFWFFGDLRRNPVGGSAAAFWPEYPPARPTRFAQIDRLLWDPNARLAKMDDYGVHAQVLYPNVGGFGAGRMVALDDPELTLACVQAYNDYLAEFASAAPGRYIPIMGLPAWDLDLSIKEMDRAMALGHKGLMMSSQTEDWNMPELASPHWDPLWAAAEERGLPINFHVASGDISKTGDNPFGKLDRATFASMPVWFTIANARAIAKLTFGGVCHRFPDLKFVSVESGVGWIPYVLASADWQWKNMAITQEHPEYDLLPSEYFKRQIYACFWFEDQTLHQAIDILGDDNILYETDFPHPTSMTPGPASAADIPRDFLVKAMEGLPESTVRKVLHDNAACLYHL